MHDANQKVIAYLDMLAAEGKPIPSIRTIRETLNVSTNVIGPAIKAWRIIQTEARAKEINDVATNILGDKMNSSLDESWNNLRQAILSMVLDTTKSALQEHEQFEKSRATEAATREVELRSRALDAELKSDELLTKNGWLVRELELETLARKKAEQERDMARKERDQLENDHEAMRQEIERLTAIVNDLNPRLL